MAIIALLIAIEVILSRFLSIQTPIVRIGFGFLPIVIIAVMYGPVYAGIAGAMADFLGAMLFPIGPFFPGFTITAFLIGVVYGFLLHKREANVIRSLIRVGIAAFIVTVLLQLGLDTLWISIITGSEYSAWLPLRAVRTAFMLPIQIIVISLVLASKQLFPLLSDKTDVEKRSFASPGFYNNDADKAEVDVSDEAESVVESVGESDNSVVIEPEDDEK